MRITSIPGVKILYDKKIWEKNPMNLHSFKKHVRGILQLLEMKDGIPVKGCPVTIVIGNKGNYYDPNNHTLYLAPATAIQTGDVTGLIYFNDIHFVRTLAHEMRHAYQAAAGEDFEDYIDYVEEGDWTAYHSQPIERDARSFATKYVVATFGIDECMDELKDFAAYQTYGYFSLYTIQERDNEQA